MDRGAFSWVLVLLWGLGGSACKDGKKMPSTAKPVVGGMPVAMRPALRPALRAVTRPAVTKRPKVEVVKSPRIVKQPKGMFIAQFVFRKRRNMIRVFSSSIDNISWVRITMTKDGKVTLSDKGKSVGRVTYRRKAVCQSQVEVRKWQAEYKGTWRKKDNKLVIKIRRLSNRCTWVSRCDNRPPKHKKCDKITRRLTLTCTLGTIAQRIDPLGSSKKQIPAWICSQGGARTHTSTPWNFGGDRCVKRYSGTRGPFRYQQCVLDN